MKIILPALFWVYAAAVQISSDYTQRYEQYQDIDEWWLDFGRNNYWSLQTDPDEYVDAKRPVVQLKPGMATNDVCEVTMVWQLHLFESQVCPFFAIRARTKPEIESRVVHHDARWCNDPDCDYEVFCDVPVDLLDRSKRRQSSDNPIIWRTCRADAMKRAVSGTHRIRCPKGQFVYIAELGTSVQHEKQCLTAKEYQALKLTKKERMRVEMHWTADNLWPSMQTYAGVCVDKYSPRASE